MFPALTAVFGIARTKEVGAVYPAAKQAREVTPEGTSSLLTTAWQRSGGKPQSAIIGANGPDEFIASMGDDKQKFRP